MFHLSSKKALLVFFAQLAKEPIINFLKANYMFFSSDIFAGNSQFFNENYFYSNEQREFLFRNSNVELAKKPLHKSCFTSLQKKRDWFFCTTCKRVYNKFFESKLYVFSSYLKE